LRHTSVLAIGGNHFTNDLAVGLRLSVSEAERVKRQFGAAMITMVSDTEEVDMMQAGQGRKISRRHIAEIIQPRAEELLELIKQELTASSGYDIASTGIVLTGGGALLGGFDKIAEAILGLPVRIGSVRDANGYSGSINSPIYATGAGLVLHSYEAETNRMIYGDTFNGIFSKMKGWVKEIFR